MVEKAEAKTAHQDVDGGENHQGQILVGRGKLFGKFRHAFDGDVSSGEKKGLRDKSYHGQDRHFSRIFNFN